MSLPLTAPKEGPSSDTRNRAHVCLDCGRLHDVVPTCVTCDESVQLRRYWYEMGLEQGRREQFLEDTQEKERLLQRISELEGNAGQQLAKTLAGPSYAELQRRRYGGV